MRIKPTDWTDEGARRYETWRQMQAVEARSLRQRAAQLIREAERIERALEDPLARALRQKTV